MSLVAVTGAGGLVGGALARALEASGRRVRRLGRRPGETPWTLAAPVDQSALAGAEALVHCAWDFSQTRAAGVFKVNVDGSAALFKAARRAGIRRILFVSSVSALPPCGSDYARAKRAAEEACSAEGGVSARPGLVWSFPPSGLFASLERLAGAMPLLPVFDGGRQPFFTVHAEDLAAALTKLLGVPDSSFAPPPALAHPDPVAFADLLKKLAARRGKSLAALSVPGALAFAGLRALEAVGLRPPFRSDSLRGLLETPTALDPEPARRLGLSFRAFLAEPAPENGIIGP